MSFAVVQDHLLAYMKKEFTFSHLVAARLGDPMHFHSYSLDRERDSLRLELTEQLSTDTDGISKCLGLQSEAKVELQVMIEQIEAKLSEETLMTVEIPPPAASLVDEATDES